MLLYQISLFFAHDAPVEEQLSCALMSGRAKECNREELGDCLIGAARQDVTDFMSFNRQLLIRSSTVTSVHDDEGLRNTLSEGRESQTRLFQLLKNRPGWCIIAHDETENLRVET